MKLGSYVGHAHSLGAYVSNKPEVVAAKVDYTFWSCHFPCFRILKEPLVLNKAWAPIIAYGKRAQGIDCC
jgi:hypothetical protein